MFLVCFILWAIQITLIIILASFTLSLCVFEVSLQLTHGLSPAASQLTLQCLELN